MTKAEEKEFKYPKITFTCTTFNRLPLFIESMNSFLDTCQDKDLISEWLVGDDGSEKSQIFQMQRRYPFIKVLTNNKVGQHSNLNSLWSHVKTEWFFHSEDDWLYLKKDNYIRKMLDIVLENENIKNVTLRNWTGGEIYKTNSGILFNVHKYTPDISHEENLKTNGKWFGYSIGVSLQHKPTLNILGEYCDLTSPKTRVWDKPIAAKYLCLGFKTANLCEGIYVKHLGEYKSAYNIRRRIK